MPIMPTLKSTLTAPITAPIAKMIATLTTAIIAIITTSSATAQQVSQDLPLLGIPHDKGYNFQTPATELARDLQWLDNFLLIIIGAISVFVTLLLAWVVIRYRASVNPTPARFTHNTAVEIAWTVIPVIILLAMIPPSLSFLNKQQIIPKADLTIKATGNQWYWTYDYIDHGFGFDSLMLQRDELEAHGYSQAEYLLATDTAVIVPVNRTVVVQITASDVIHSWTIPAFGVKQDGVPGRLAELWFRAEKIGVYFGQCSELCGKDHSSMPITVKVVSEREYLRWLNSAIQEYADVDLDTPLNPPAPKQVVSNR